MNHFLSIFTLFLFTQLCLSCGQIEDRRKDKVISEDKDEKVSKDEYAEIISLSRELTGIVFTEMQMRLSNAIDEGGISNAVEYCSEVALQLTDSISNAHNVRIHRISDKARNTTNRATEDEIEIINRFKSGINNSELPEPVITQSEEAYTFYSPIVISNQLCLNCHGKVGEDIDSEDYILINLLYPEDKATGYKLNDVRGLWKVVHYKPTL